MTTRKIKVEATIMVSFFIDFDDSELDEDVEFDLDDDETSEKVVEAAEKFVEEHLPVDFSMESFQHDNLSDDPEDVRAASG